MIDIAKKVFQVEIETLQKVANNLDHNFSASVEAIIQAKGKFIICGMGKSGLIGKKIAATLASTGTPSFFIHPGEAFHGDLGMIGKDDIVMLISFSGETDEVLKVIPYLKWNKNKIIAISGNPESTLAKNADFHLNIAVTEEACPLALAPTSSTTATLVIGDALAVALMQTRNFKPEDFARFHPGGSLGRKLLTTVKDLMRSEKLPFINIDANFSELILNMSAGRLGMVIIGNAENVHGIITDGDLRRGLLNHERMDELKIKELMNTHPKFVKEDTKALDAEELMRENRITTILVYNNLNHLSGIYQIFN